MYKQALLKKTTTGAAMPNKNAMSVRFSAVSKLKTESSLWQSFSSYKSLNSLCSRNNTVWKSGVFFSFNAQDCKMVKDEKMLVGVFHDIFQVFIFGV